MNKAVGREAIILPRCTPLHSLSGMARHAGRQGRGAVAVPGACPRCGTCAKDGWRAGWVGAWMKSATKDPHHGVVSATKEEPLSCARPEPISTKLKPCPACPILEPPQGLCQNRVLGSGICPIRLLPAGVAGPAPPFVPRSAQEGGCQTGGTGSEHHREPCPVLTQCHECNPHRSGP